MSAFLDFLDWAKTPGQAGLNVFAGRPDAARRHLLDFLAGPVDMLLPGDMIGQQAGVEDEARPTGNQTIDDLLGAAVNPLTYAPFFPGVKQAVRSAGTKAVGALPGSVRRAAGWEQLDPQAEELINRAGALGAQTARSQTGYLESAVKNRVGRLSDVEDQALADVIGNVQYDAAGNPVWDPTNRQASWLAKTGTAFAPDKADDLATRVQKVQGRLTLWEQQNPGKLDPSRVNGLKDLLGDYYQFADTQLNEAKSMAALDMNQSQGDYLQRLYENAPGRAGAGAGRVFDDPDQIAEFLATSPKDVKLNRSFMERAAIRAEGQGNMLRRAKLADDLGIGAPIHAPEFKTEAGARLKAFEATSPDTYQRLRYELNMDGIADPGEVEKVMMRVNRIFKPAAVYGVGPFVRIGSIVRNHITEPQQRLTDPVLAAAAAKDPTYILKNLWGAINDAVASMTGKRITKDEVGEAFDLLEKAAAGGKGEALGQVAELRRLGGGSPVVETLAEAVETGVLEGFARSETLATNLVAKGSKLPEMVQYWAVPGNKGFNLGQSLFSGVENRIRFAMFADLRKAGVGAEEAARRVNDAALNYASNSVANRNVRAWFPFAQFALQSAKQQGKFLATVPGALTGTAALFDTREDAPFLDYQTSKAGISTGPEARVNGVSNPAEIFNLFPGELGTLGGFSDALASGPGSMLHPIPKTGVQLLTGRDIFRDQEWDPRLPGRTAKDERTALDTTWGVGESLGVLTPVGSPARAAASVAASPVSGGVRFLTGLESVPADALRAEVRRLQRDLENAPEVREFQSLYGNDSTPVEMLDALDRLRQARKELAGRAAP